MERRELQLNGIVSDLALMYGELQHLGAAFPAVDKLEIPDIAAPRVALGGRISSSSLNYRLGGAAPQFLRPMLTPRRFLAHPGWDPQTISNRFGLIAPARRLSASAAPRILATASDLACSCRRVG